jgi:hypothetical protein
MKYYVYISDSKVDMLLPQVPHEVKKKVATEWKLDLKIFGATRKEERETHDNRVARLEAVVSFIEEFGNVGSADEPGEYVEDTLPMRWGPYGWWRGSSDSPLVYFGGETENTIIGLGGSSMHLLGNKGPSVASSHSATPSLMAYLGKELALDLGEDEDPYPPLQAVDLATSQMRGPQQTTHFLAKKLLFGPGTRGRKTLLATPLYVTLGD